VGSVVGIQYVPEILKGKMRLPLTWDKLALTSSALSFDDLSFLAFAENLWKTGFTS
jgi:hypothetical protein